MIVCSFVSRMYFDGVSNKSSKTSSFAVSHNSVKFQITSLKTKLESLFKSPTKNDISNILVNNRSVCFMIPCFFNVLVKKSGDDKGKGLPKAVLH